MNYIGKEFTAIEMGGLDYADYPKFCDAYVEYVEIDGVPATDEELHFINNDGALVHELLTDFIY